MIAAPTGVASAQEAPQDVINRLRSQDYQVNIDRVGVAPLNECVVTGVRNPRTVTQLVPLRGVGLGKRDRRILVPITISQSVSVSLDCSR